MKITKLTIRNVFRINAVDITPEGDFVQIGGENAQGKSAVLDALTLAFSGKKGFKGKKILHEGAIDGEILAETEKYIVRVKVGEGDKLSLNIKTRDGYPIQGAKQSKLDELYGDLTFDPLRWQGMANQEQLKVLKDVFGIDFSDLDLERSLHYEKRTEVNQEVKRLSGAISSHPLHNQDLNRIPDEPVDTAELMEEMNGLGEDLGLFAAACEELDTEVDSLTQLQMDVQTLTDRLEASVKNADRVADNVESLRKAKDEWSSAAGLNPNEVIQRKHDIAATIGTASENNQKISSKKHYINLIADHKDQMALTKGLTNSISEVDASKNKLLADAKIPVAGLTISDDGVLFNGIPFSQASAAEKLKVSVAMGIAMNPELNVILIRDGSLLDKNSRALVAAMAKENDYQVWLEVVGDDEDCNVIIDDGYSYERKPGKSLSLVDR